MTGLNARQLSLSWRTAVVLFVVGCGLAAGGTMLRVGLVRQMHADMQAGSRVTATVVDRRSGRTNHSYRLEFDYRGRVDRVWVEPLGADPDYDVGAQIQAVISGTADAPQVTTDTMTGSTAKLLIIDLILLGGLASVFHERVDLVGGIG